jgi:phage terminase small subunit
MKRIEEVAISNELLKAPEYLNDNEKAVWNMIADLIISSTHYKKTSADV